MVQRGTWSEGPRSSDEVPGLDNDAGEGDMVNLEDEQRQLDAVAVQQSALDEGAGLEPSLLRRFCGTAGYGCDYPDSEYRDVPLCFPHFLCDRLMLMVLTSGNFRVSPAGLICVHQSLKTFQPIDELKKGPFTLQAGVLGYQQTAAGVEVDVRLSATSRSESLVWESTLRLFSQSKRHQTSTRVPINGRRSQQEEAEDPENVKQVELRVPRSSGLLSLGSSFYDSTFFQLLSLPARLLPFRSQATPGLWMLSVCLAEIEKHKGVGVITAPVSVTARFEEPLLAPGKVTISFWQAKRGLNFNMTQHGQNSRHVVGRIFKS
ncbi:uncharacterized protein KZ484_003033 [Pholidichthys leucotaenia]